MLVGASWTSFRLIKKKKIGKPVLENGSILWATQSYLRGALLFRPRGHSPGAGSPGGKSCGDQAQYWEEGASEELLCKPENSHQYDTAVLTRCLHCDGSFLVLVPIWIFSVGDGSKGKIVVS